MKNCIKHQNFLKRLHTSLIIAHRYKQCRMTSREAFYKNRKRVRWVFWIQNFQVDPYYEPLLWFMISSVRKYTIYGEIKFATWHKSPLLLVLRSSSVIRILNGIKVFSVKSSRIQPMHLNLLVFGKETPSRTRGNSKPYQIVKQCYQSQVRHPAVATV